MSISIRFDNNNMPIEPTLVLMTRSGKKLGAINAHNINATDNLNSYSELFFSVNKTDAEEIWDSIVDFKLVWVREWNQVYEIYVEYKESQGFIKNVTAKSLGHAELSQINIYNLNANNDTDIENDDVRTVLYNSSDHSHSLLHRIIDEKAPHYTVNHVDTWIRSIQRTFEFNNINILEAFNQIAEEIDCIIFVDTSIDGTTGLIKREINVYDLEYYCSGSNCNYRGNFVDTCPICGGTNILPGYGNDTTIFVSADNLSDEIDLSVNTDSVKNCFKLEAGDELMTATVMNCNPNGSQYLWYITDDTKADMPSNLVDKIEDYDELYEDYQTTHSYDLSSATSNYNTVANTYKTYDASLQTITSPVAGFQNLMESYYDAIDLRIFVSDKCMPTISIPATTAATQVGLLTNASLSPVAVQSLSTVSTATATSYVLAIAKTFINSNYELNATATTGVSKTTVDGVVTAATWTGTFTATSYSDETDSATSSAITVSLTDDYSDFLKQRIKKILSSDEDDNDNNIGIIALFNKTLDTDTTPNFYTELHKYGLSSLKIFESCCQGCLDVLISIGAGNTNTWYDDSLNLNDNYDDDVAVVTYTGTSSTGGTVNYYRSFYKPYYKRLLAIQSEIVTREGELAKVDAMMDLIQEKVADTQEALDFRAYLGTTLWNIFSSYRRDDVFSNENFVSDGLDNAELFNMAREFLNDATKEIYKSANLQHSITATLSNLLVMKEFAPIVDYFKVGNWIRVRIEDNIYKLRLISYSVDFDNLSNITVEFSDITRMIDGLSDIESLLNSASSMATSYDYVKRQSKKGLASNEQLRHWVEDGLSLTNLKIVSTAEEQDVAFDEHGILAREYLPLTDSYDNKQLKIINRGLYVTDDNWKTCKAGVGDFLFYDPEEEEVVEGYGVIADTIVGKIILGQEVGIYNTGGTIKLDEDGFKLVADMTADSTNRTIYSIQRKTLVDNTDNIDDLLYIDSEGSLVLNGKVRINSVGNSGATYESVNTTNLNYTKVTTPIASELSTYYEKVNNVYSLTSDTSIVSNKDYYVSNIDMSELYELTPGGYRLTDDASFSAASTYYKRGYELVVTPTTSEISGYYEKTGDAYVLTSDSSINNNKTYYAMMYIPVESPQLANIGTYYEYTPASYHFTTDSSVNSSKIYYIASYSPISVFNESEISSYYEYFPAGYYKTSDTSITSGKTYYTLGYSRVSSPSNANLIHYYEYKAAHYAKTNDVVIASGKNYYTVSYSEVSSPQSSDVATYYELVPGHYQLTEDTILVSGKAYCLAVYTNVSSPTSDGLSSYYEKTSEYVLTTDTAVKSSKVYYTRSINTVSNKFDSELSSYYELVSGNYVLTTDTTCNSNKTYYTIHYSSVASPSNNNIGSYYEAVAEPYSITQDSAIVSGKTYYTKSYSVVSNPTVYDIGSYYEYITNSYQLTSDTTVSNGKIYYNANYSEVESPSAANIHNYYEYVANGYDKTTDTTVNRSKTYYVEDYNSVANPISSRLGQYYENLAAHYSLTSDNSYHSGKVYYSVTYSLVNNPSSYSVAALYERTPEVYELTDDTSISSGKTYYIYGYGAVSSPTVENISSYYEYRQATYTLTTDQSVVVGKAYYHIVYNPASDVNSTTFNTSDCYEYYSDLYTKTNDTAVNSSKSYYSYDNNGNYTLREVIDGTTYKSVLDKRLHDEFEVEGSGIGEMIKASYTSITDDIKEMVNSYKAEVGQYLTFDENGLTIGAKSANNVESRFKTVIDNTALRFVENNETVAYINGQQLYINNAVINQALYVGNFFFTATTVENGTYGLMHGLTIIHDSMITY